jgi:hypothetical protein
MPLFVSNSKMIKLLGRWLMPVMSALRKLRQKVLKFKASLSYIGSSKPVQPGLYRKTLPTKKKKKKSKIKIKEGTRCQEAQLLQVTT